MNPCFVESTVTFAQLRLDGDGFFNPRTSTGLAPAEIGETAMSIVRYGLLVPLLVRAHEGDMVVVIAGQRRYLALDMLRRWITGEVMSDPGLRALIAPTDGDADLQQSIRVMELLKSIPVRIIRGQVDLKSVALVDNLIRRDLSSFEIARYLADMSDEGKTGVAIAKLIGKSTGYVSRKLSSWRGAGPELRGVWERGDLEEHLVHELSQLPVEQQSKALAGPVPRGRRGPTHRPSVDAQRDLLHDLETKPTVDKQDFAYRAGVVDALRWATGQTSSPSFAQLANDSEGT